MSKNSGLINFFTEEIEILYSQEFEHKYCSKKRYFFLLKRWFDILVSVLFILGIVSWLTPVIALLIKCSSKGPVFFRQKRMGKGCKIFTCFKFRTMIVNEEADEKQATIDDRRITVIGNFLRKTNIDELPQLINVLIGDMSIVGPRPHMLSEHARFSSIIADYKFRNVVKPGLTGMAQVKGFHGPTPDFENIFRRYQWDAFYVRNADFWLDFRIVLETFIQRISFLLFFFF